jgi:hypothetical protein
MGPGGFTKLNQVNPEVGPSAKVTVPRQNETEAPAKHQAVRFHRTERRRPLLVSVHKADPLLVTACLDYGN